MQVTPVDSDKNGLNGKSEGLVETNAPTVPAPEVDPVAFLAQCVESMMERPPPPSLYIRPPLPKNEPQRLAVTKALGVEGLSSEERFDAVTEVLRVQLNAPLSLITIIYQDTIQVLSASGSLVAGGPPLVLSAAPRSDTFCERILTSPHPGIIVVEDALLDPRFCHNPFVTGPLGVRSYAGAPLVGSSSNRYGTLCVIDFHPRSFTTDQLSLLADLSEIVVREIEQDAVKLRNAFGTDLGSPLRDISCFSEGVMLCDVAQPHWPIHYVNDSWCKATGISSSEACGRSFWTLFASSNGASLDEVQDAWMAVKSGEPFKLAIAPRNSQKRNVKMTFTPSKGRFHPETAIAVPETELERQMEPLERPIPCPCVLPTGRPRSELSQDKVSALAAALNALDPISTGTEEASSPFFYIASVLTTTSTKDSATSFEVSTPKGNDEGVRCRSSERPPFNCMSPVEFKKVSLGPMLAIGSRSRVFRGVWHGEKVGVKVIDSWIDADDVNSKLSATNSDGDKNAKGKKGAALQATISLNLVHPNIVRTYAAGESYGASDSLGRVHQQVWLVQELCAMGTLQSAVDGEVRGLRAAVGRPDLVIVLRIMLEVAQAVNYVHRRGIVHGNINLNNILLCPSLKDERTWTAKLSDFSSASPCTLSERESSMAVETPVDVSHSAPEVLKGGSHSQSSDIFAFGVVFWECMCGVRAWLGHSSGGIIENVVHRKKVLEVPGAASVSAKNLLRRCMSYDPSDRPPAKDIIMEIKEQLRAAKVSRIS